MAFLQDFHHTPAILDYPPKLVAIACINPSFQIYGVVVLLMDECDMQPWFNVSDINLEVKFQRICFARLKNTMKISVFENIFFSTQFR